MYRLDNTYTLVREDAESAEETDCDICLCRDNNGDVSRVCDAGWALVNPCLSDTSNMHDRLSGLPTHTPIIYGTASSSTAFDDTLRSKFSSLGLKKGWP